MNKQADIKPVNFPAEVVSAFTDGDCWELASAVEGEFGFPVVTINATDDMFCWCHAGNRLPNGDILDIEGVWSEAAWVSEWTHRDYGSKAKPGILTTKEWTREDWEIELKDGEFEHAFTESMESLMYAYELVEEACPELAEL